MLKILTFNLLYAPDINIHNVVSPKEMSLVVNSLARAVKLML